MRHFSATEQAILQSLALFQYLTATQCMKLGITKTRKGVYPTLARLIAEHKPTIARINYTVSPVYGRPESVHYLTAQGVKILQEMGLGEGDIKHPRRTSVSFASDHSHRISTINFFIAVKLWADRKAYDMRDFSFYFQQGGGSNRNNKGGVSLSDNRLDIEAHGVGYIVPDGVVIVDRPDATPVFALFEQHNGKDTKRFLEQVHGHTLAMAEGIPSIKFDVKHAGEYVANRVFCVFENEACMQSAMHRLAKSADFQPFLPLFYFKTETSLDTTNFEDGWLLANGKSIGI
jgi:hypothetical protein